MLRVTAAPRVSSENSPLTRVADVRLPGSAVRFDYQSLDQKAGRLYISHMNADQLVIFDIKRNQAVANLDGFPRVHGVWAVPDVGRVYASITGEHKVAVVDMQSLRTIARVGAGGISRWTCLRTRRGTSICVRRARRRRCSDRCEVQHLNQERPAGRRSWEHGIRCGLRKYPGRSSQKERTGQCRSVLDADCEALGIAGRRESSRNRN
jgi:hypothetical protein